MRHPVFPLKPYSLRLTKAQPPDSLGLIGCRRPHHRSQRSAPSCRRGGGLAQVTALLTGGGGGGDCLHFPEEVTRRVLQLGSHQRLRCLCHGNGSGDPSEGHAQGGPECGTTGAGERTDCVRPCGFGEKPRSAPARAG